MKSTKKSNGRSPSNGRSTKREDEIRRAIMDEVYRLMNRLQDKYIDDVFVHDVILQGLDVEDGRTRVTIKTEHYKPMAEFEARKARKAKQPPSRVDINDMLDEYIGDGIERMGIALPQHPAFSQS
jgi:hypothetical protein